MSTRSARSASRLLSIDFMLFGTAEIVVDDKPISAYRFIHRGPEGQTRAHAGEQAGVVADFYARIADVEAPPLEIFSRWYPELHMEQFAATRADVPKGDELAADYACFLRQVKRFAKRDDQTISGDLREGLARARAPR